MDKDDSGTSLKFATPPWELRGALPRRERTKRQPVPPEDRFVRFIEFTDDCWIWRGALDQCGYGRFDSGKSAHRWVYTHFVEPIPEGLTLDHLCFGTACVNPDHLEPVTRTVNNLRSWERRRQMKREKVMQI